MSIIMFTMPHQYTFSAGEHRDCSSCERSGSGDSLLWVLQDVRPLLVPWLCWKTGQAPASKGNTGRTGNLVALFLDLRPCLGFKVTQLVQHVFHNYVEVLKLTYFDTV